MKRGLGVLMAAALMSLTFFAVDAAFAQKAGGILKISHFDSPASMSLLEESTTAAIRPMMGVFNNLVVYDQNVPQNSMRSIVPELATGWSTNEEGTELIFPLRQGVKWHDGKPFTAQDVKCTWELLAGRANEKLRINPRRSWYGNVEEVTPNGDFQASSGRSRLFWRCWLPAGRRSIPAMSAHATCAVVQSAQDRLNSSNSSRTR